MNCGKPNKSFPQCYTFGDIIAHRLNFLMESKEYDRLAVVKKELHNREFNVMYIKPIHGVGKFHVERPPLPLVTPETKEEQIINAIAEYGGVRF